MEQRLLTAVNHVNGDGLTARADRIFQYPLSLLIGAASTAYATPRKHWAIAIAT